MFFFLEKIHLADENNLVFGGGMLVKKRGRTSGDTTGKLVGDCLYVRVYSTEVRGRYYEFENCFSVKPKDKTTRFFLLYCVSKNLIMIIAIMHVTVLMLLFFASFACLKIMLIFIFNM